jgi:hypothetical protein
MPVVARDSFERVVASGWGIADQGGPWTVGAGDWSVGGGKGRLTAPNAGAWQAVLLGAPALDVEVFARVSLEKLTTGDSTPRLCARALSTGSWYAATVGINSSQVVSLGLSKMVNNSFTTLLSNTIGGIGITYAVGMALCIRLRATGTYPTTLQAKVWADGTPEPDWQRTITDSEPILQVAGGLGARVNQSAGDGSFFPLTFEWDDLELFDLRPDPVLALDRFERESAEGWGSAETGGPWTGTSTQSITSGRGQISLPGASTAFAPRLSTITPIFNGEMLVDVAYETAPGGAGADLIYVCGRELDASNFYRTILSRNPANALTFALGKRVAGSMITLGSTSALGTYITGERWAVRFRFTGSYPTRLQAKAWKVGTPEPTGWMLEEYDSEPVLQVAGMVGVFSNRSSTFADSVHTYDNFTVVAADNLTDVARDSFEREVTDGWGSADLGGAWVRDSGAAADFAVTAGKARIILPTSGSAPAMRLALPLVSSDLLARAVVGSLPSTGEVLASIIARRNVAGGYYRLDVSVSTSGAVSYIMRRTVPSFTTILSSISAGFSISAGQAIAIRARLEGSNPTRIRMKAWLAGTTEPETWSPTIADSEPALQPAGEIGLFGFSSAGNPSINLDWDDLRIVALTDNDTDAVLAIDAAAVPEVTLVDSEALSVSEGEAVRQGLLAQERTGTALADEWTVEVQLE